MPIWFITGCCTHSFRSIWISFHRHFLRPIRTNSLRKRNRSFASVYQRSKQHHQQHQQQQYQIRNNLNLRKYHTFEWSNWQAKRQTPNRESLFSIAQNAKRFFCLLHVQMWQMWQMWMGMGIRCFCSIAVLVLLFVSYTFIHNILAFN